MRHSLDLPSSTILSALFSKHDCSRCDQVRYGETVLQCCYKNNATADATTQIATVQQENQNSLRTEERRSAYNPNRVQLLICSNGAGRGIS